MNFLLPLLIVAISPDVPIEVRYPEAATVFHCTFDKSWDGNFDQWPDGWKRRQGPGYPRYVDIRISEEPSPKGDRCLRIDLDGGAAVAYSPPVEVDPLFGYVLEGYLKTEGLEHDRAYLSITLLNRKRQRLQTLFSDEVDKTGSWKKLRLGPIAPESDEVQFAVIGLHLEPESRQDLKGAALFDDLWLGRLPRMTLKTSSPCNFFTETSQVEIECTVSGSLENNPQVEFQLEDVSGRTLARQQRRVATRPAVTNTGLGLESLADKPVGLIGSAGWKPSIPGPGFYRVRSTMRGRETLVLRRELSLVVVEPRPSPTGGEFGWTLPHGDKPVPLPMLSQLVGQAGINWLKYPVWSEGPGSNQYAEQLIALGEQLGARGIKLVGLLHAPPRSLRSRYGQAKAISAAGIFAAEPEVWYPSLESILGRLATRVRWWQLGDDRDTSFVGDPNLVKKIARVKTELDQIGQDVNLGIGWDWMSELPPANAGEAPWRFLTLSTDPPMTHQELAACLSTLTDPGFQRWVVLEPLPVDVYSSEARAIDLVRRMTAAKIHGADAIFCPQPFSSSRGLMNDDGTPGELFLAWRTTALTLGGAKYLGSIELPGRSPNRIFARADDVVMIVWNDTPTEEVIYFGEKVQQIDLWGRRVTPATQQHRQVIQVGRLPTFVTGISRSITGCRMGFSLARSRIPSIFGRPHENSFRLKNDFAREVGGRVTLVMPKVWIVRPQRTNFRLAGGETLEQPFEITLPYNADSGRHKIRVDVEIQTDRSYRFSIYREINVGLGEVHIEIATALNERGELEVEQRLVNQSDRRVSFRCQLFAPGRRRQMTQLIDAGRAGDPKVYRLPKGKQLLDKTLWLHAEEINGPRTLNYRFVAKP